ncbi:MAG: 6,7-dimethyl-8-ribityllumazine synthase [Limisphaera sp.]
MATVLRGGTAVCRGDWYGRCGRCWRRGGGSGGGTGGRAYAIVLGAKLVARSGFLGRRPAAIVGMGVILRGETMHAELIGRAVTDRLMQVGLRHGLPVIHEVLLLENEAQAQRRCLDRRYNRGLEAAQTALQMARLVKRLEGSKPAQ